MPQNKFKPYYVIFQILGNALGYPIKREEDRESLLGMSKIEIEKLDDKLNTIRNESNIFKTDFKIFDLSQRDIEIIEATFKFCDQQIEDWEFETITTFKKEDARYWLNELQKSLRSEEKCD